MNRLRITAAPFRAVPVQMTGTLGRSVEHAVGVLALLQVELLVDQKWQPSSIMCRMHADE